MNNSKLLGRIIGVLLLTSFCTDSVVSTIEEGNTARWASEFRPQGAYLDEILFLIYTSTEEEDAMLALQSGNLDVNDRDIRSEFLEDLFPALTLQTSLANRYLALSLNTHRFPLNITEFRRAMAFGLDKNPCNIPPYCSEVPLDTYIPLASTEWNVENSLTTHFYDQDIVSGNTSLVAADFIDLDGDGWREYDKDGSGTWTAGDLDDTHPLMTIELWSSTQTMGFVPPLQAATMMAEGLIKMGIHSTVTEHSFDWILDQMIQGTHCVTAWTESVPIINPTKALYEKFRTETSSNKAYYKFSNSTIDEVLDRMVTANTLEEVKNLVRNISIMLAYEQPQIVYVNDIYVNAWRNDKFMGFEEFVGQGYTGDNPYSGTQIRKLDGTMGGSIKYRISEDLETPNVMMVNEKTTKMVMEYIYEGLWQTDPVTWDPIPQLAYTWEIENGINDLLNNVVDGDKYTFYLYENETWHDGTPFTSADVKFSIEEIWPKSNHYPTTAKDIYRVTIPDDYTVEIWVNGSNYFQWSEVTGIPYIVPKHIWNNVLDVSTFLPSDSQIIGTGPYKWDEYIPGEFISLIRHENWRWDIREVSVTSTTHTTTPDDSSPTSTTTSVTNRIPGFVDFVLILGIIGPILTRKSKKEKKNKEILLTQ